MKLLLVTSRFPFGPKESFLTEEISQLAQEFDLVVFPALPTDEPLAVAALRDRAVRMRMLSPNVLRAALAETIRRPLNVLRAFGQVVSAPRAMHAKIKNALIFPTALAASRLARESGIEHVHGYWLTTPSTIAYVVSRLCAIPWSASGHRYDLVDFNVRTENCPSSGFVSTSRFVRAISRQGADRLRSALPAGSPPVRVIHLGVAVPPQQKSPPREESVLRLLCAANLERVKGHEILLDALQSANESVAVHCTIAGDGTLRSYLEARSRALGLERIVTFEGVVPHAQLLERISAGEFDAAILTSLDEGPAEREGIPVFLMESMARGLPVIATRSGGIVELVNESNGILCAPGDRGELAAAIVRLGRDAALQRTLGRSGYETVLDEFDVRETARELADALRGESETQLGRKTLAPQGAAARRAVVSRGSIELDEAGLQS